MPLDINPDDFEKVGDEVVIKASAAPRITLTELAFNIANIDKQIVKLQSTIDALKLKKQKLEELLK